MDLGAIPPPPPDVPPVPEAGVPGEGRVHEVVMRLLRFDPTAVTIAPGDTVRWTNLDFVAHTVTEGNPEDAQHDFASGLMGYQDVYERTFPDPGETVYYCETHPGNMRGNTVTVR